MLFVPTQIKQLNGLYFIVDHDHHRIIYSPTIDVEIKDWTTIDYEFSGPHSIASDGDLYVVDNTGRNEVLVFNSSFRRIQTFSNVGTRPHKVIYNNGYFYVIGSQSQNILRYYKSAGILVQDYNKTLSFLSGTYVRSIKIIDGYMYFLKNNREIVQANYLSGNYEVINTYTLPGEFVEIVDIEKFNGQYFISAMGTPETTGFASKLVKGNSISAIAAGSYTDIYSSVGMLGKPYFFEVFNSKLFFGEVGEISNSIVSLDTSYTTSFLHRKLGVETESYIRSSMYPK